MLLLSQLSLLNGILRQGSAGPKATIKVAESLNRSSQLKQANSYELVRVVSIGGTVAPNWPFPGTGQFCGRLPPNWPVSPD
jgi:hypothetical protein